MTSNGQIGNKRATSFSTRIAHRLVVVVLGFLATGGAGSCYTERGSSLHNHWFRSVVVITADSESETSLSESSANPGSTPGETFIFASLKSIF